MQKLAAVLVPFLFFVLMLAVGICLASPASETQKSTTKSTPKTANTHLAATAKRDAKSTESATSKKKSNVLASAEDLSGTITAVAPSDTELTLIGSNGVPYDFDLTKKTRIEASGNKIGMNQLGGEKQKQATVHFVPTSRGNLADSIRISGS